MFWVIFANHVLGDFDRFVMCGVIWTDHVFGDLDILYVDR